MEIAAVRKLALALPQAVEAPHHHLVSFRVRGKIFATLPPTRDGLHVFVADNERELAIAMYPGWISALLWGGRVAGLRIELGKARPKVVAGLLWEAWRVKAPKRLAALHPTPPGAGAGRA